MVFGDDNSLPDDACRRSARRRRPTAAILIIGNEILSGKFADTNSGHLIRLLRDVGIQTRRVVILPDEVEVIAEEVRQASRLHDHVFTSGGIGPTHDDRTLEAVARAFDVPLLEHPRLSSSFRRRIGAELSEAQVKMTCIPAGSELHPGGDYFYPLLRCRNVFVLPGVPSMFEDKLALVRPLLEGMPLALRRLLVHGSESRLAPYLNRIVGAHPEVEIGSYPFFDAGGSTVEVTLEATTDEQVDAALQELRRILPPELPCRVC